MNDEILGNLRKRRGGPRRTAARGEGEGRVAKWDKIKGRAYNAPDDSKAKLSVGDGVATVQSLQEELKGVTAGPASAEAARPKTTSQEQDKAGHSANADTDSPVPGQ